MFQILVDSAANLPAELVKKYQINVLSFVNLVNGKSLTCFAPDLTPEEERARGTEYYQSIRTRSHFSFLETTESFKSSNPQIFQESESTENSYSFS